MVRRPISTISAPTTGTDQSKVRHAVVEVAADLLELYAKRQLAQGGYAFEPDSDWQRELEASFPYIETPDQLLAIEQIKTDMESSRPPMDRLLCGDVGYGKTEVALRAAFKAVADNKQVAVLVPTTVLAQQHYETFRQRLAVFPVEVEMLSRFRTPKEQDKIIKDLASKRSISSSEHTAWSLLMLNSKTSGWSSSMKSSVSASRTRNTSKSCAKRWMCSP